MEKLAGIAIKQLDFVAENQGDLLYHEGPLLSHFTDAVNENIHYIYKWCDCSDLLNRWLIVKVSKSDLLNFFYQNVSLRNLVETHPYVFFVDIDNGMVHREVTIVATDSISVDYLPFEDSYYDEDLYEDYALSLKRKLAMIPVIQEYRRLEASTIQGYFPVNDSSKTNLSFHLSSKAYLGLSSYLNPPNPNSPHQVTSIGTILYIRTNMGIFEMPYTHLSASDLFNLLKKLQQYSDLSFESLLQEH